MNRLSHDDMEKLIQRFMDGQTTLDEEARLAQYLRSAKVPSEWRHYQQMFAWFDEGMPEARPQSTRKHVRLWLLVSATAAIGLLLVILQPWKQMAEPSESNPSPPPLTAIADTATAGTQATDTLVQPRQHPSKQQRKARRHRHSPAPPTVFYAEHRSSTSQPETGNATVDSQQMVAARIAAMEQEQHDAIESLQQRAGSMQQAIAVLLRAQELEAALAMEDLFYEPETNDDELW